MKETFGALGVGVAIAAIVACGGAKSAMRAPASASPDAGLAMNPDDPKARIAKLDESITTEFAKLELGLRPEAPPVAANLCPEPPCAKTESLAVKPSDDKSCIKGESQICKDTCQIADAICGAATTICEIADSMKTDTWAAEKCASGNASCEKSRGKCCGCV